MKVENAVTPLPEQIQEFLSTPGPVMMVNLLKFKETADYADGREPELSGREAYLRYAAEMKKLVEASGGRVVFAAAVRGLLLGRVEELWDEVAIVEYPSTSALIEIASSPRYREIEEHRMAGLEGQLNLTASQDDFA